MMSTMTSNETLVPVRALALAWVALARKEMNARGATGSSRLRVFLDCDARFEDSIRSEIDFVEYVRSRPNADVSLSVTPGGSQARADRCTVRFVGGGRFAGIEADARVRIGGCGTTPTRRGGPTDGNRRIRRTARGSRPGLPPHRAGSTRTYDSAATDVSSPIL